MSFPKTDWKIEDVKEGIEKNSEELKNKEFKTGKSKVHFLTGLLGEKHEEMKAMRKLVESLSKITGVARTANELETIEQVGEKSLTMLKTIEVIESKTKKEIKKPEEAPAAAKKEKPSSDVEKDLFEKLAEG